jgi:predicted metal-binding protein
MTNCSIRPVLRELVDKSPGELRDLIVGEQVNSEERINAMHTLASRSSTQVGKVEVFKDGLLNNSIAVRRFAMLVIAQFYNSLERRTSAPPWIANEIIAILKNEQSELLLTQAMQTRAIIGDCRIIEECEELLCVDPNSQRAALCLIKCRGVNAEQAILRAMSKCDDIEIKQMLARALAERGKGACEG